MNLLNQFSLIGKNFAALGQYRMIAILGGGALALAMVVAAALYLGQPTYENLYIGLQGDDVTQMGTTLATANIPFKIGPDGKSISVPSGMKNRARMLLAERGLPTSSTAGYELFDHVGSLGLTSFMQQITRVRALEGEIARTIESIDGITGARVHIVMADRGNFRTGEQKPTASVVIRASDNVANHAASPIRHLVAASVPGLSVDDVTVLDTSGRLLASGDDPANSSLTRSLDVTQTVQSEIAKNIDKALAPVLGRDNFRTSVTANLNTDAQQIHSVVYDPDSKVERSVRVTKENQQSDRTTPSAPATVSSNLPQANPTAPKTGPKSSEANERKEEQTNYEINSTTTNTTRNSYRIEKLSIAVVIDQARVAAMLGGKPTQADIDKYVAELQKTVATAAGFDKKRGDQINLTVMKFLPSPVPASAAAGPNVLDTLNSHLSGLINALALVVVAFLVVWFGLRPLARSVVGAQEQAQLEDASVSGLELPDYSPAAVGTGNPAVDGFGENFAFDQQEGLLMMEENQQNFNRRVKEGPEKRLARMVEINEERAAKILRKWVAEKAA
ncbi:MAG TPA: flagellar basal-body MS-ring/collar protein FliF [Pararhizobium sp.]|jgi:flagellar M-ring protein FliF|nr:flagellar basal-body MS-ring/collar protein FliF [Pararhizobium sp.]